VGKVAIFDESLTLTLVCLHPVDVHLFVVSVTDFVHQPRVNVDIDYTFKYLNK